MNFSGALRANSSISSGGRCADLDLLVIDDVHFPLRQKATQEEFCTRFNSIEAMAARVVMASDNHPKMIEEFGESLINRFVSGMVVRIDRRISSRGASFSRRWPRDTRCSSAKM